MPSNRAANCWPALALALVTGCGEGSGAADPDGGAAGGAGSGGSGASAASGGSAGVSGAGAVGGASGNAGGGVGGAAGGGGEAGAGGVAPTTGCADRLAPVDAEGAVERVGDGSAASCTEDALHDAVAALNAVSGGGTLLFDCGGEHTFSLTRSVFVETSMIIDGGGVITLDGGKAVRVVELDHHVDFVLQRITIQNGFVPAGSENESGAGLLHPWFGTLRVIDVAFLDNHAESEVNDVGGGAIYAGGLTSALISGSTFARNSGSVGGAVLSRSTNLRVVDSTFTENSATTWADSGQYGNGGGLYIDRMWLDDPVDFVICGATFTRNHAKVHGSALFSYNLEGTGARFERCTFQDNDMQGSPGGGTGTVYHQGVPLTLVDSTFAGNATGAHAGGLFLGGGTDAVVANCTFWGNTTPGNAGALWAGNGNVAVTSSTFAANGADYGPVFFKGQSGTLVLTSVVLANNTTDNAFSAVACHETFDDGGGNLQWPSTKNNGNPDTKCAAGITLADPLLEALADNGGPTRTMALGATSPAVDLATTCPAADQRGLPRVGACDAGAFEHQK